MSTMEARRVIMAALRENEAVSEGKAAPTKEQEGGVRPHEPGESAFKAILAEDVDLPSLSANLRRPVPM
jgi:hypothetical protein